MDVLRVGGFRGDLQPGSRNCLELSIVNNGMSGFSRARVGVPFKHLHDRDIFVPTRVFRVAMSPPDRLDSFIRDLHVQRVMIGGKAGNYPPYRRPAPLARSRFPIHRN
jgi:hypothetical protein